MTGQLVGKVDSLMGSPLRYHDDASDLLHLGVVWWAGAIQVASNLKPTQDMVSISKSKCFDITQAKLCQQIKTCARRSEMQMNFLRTFLGRM